MIPNPDFDTTARLKNWETLIAKCEEFITGVSDYPVSPNLDPGKIKDLASKYDFSQAVDFDEALNHVFFGLTKYQVHTPHPGYYGLYNPRPVFPGIAGDLITGVFNPQLAAWSHSPFANEVENHLIMAFGLQFGYPPESLDGNFTYGGGESNFTAVLCALSKRFPEYSQTGISGINNKPVFYASAESHHSFLKAARMAGLGTNSLRLISVDRHFKMDPDKLLQTVKNDIRDGYTPFMVASTAGTTGAGIIDPLEDIQSICENFHIWHHVDAAFGGAGILLPELKPLFSGIEKSDSLIFDAHKWLSVPMAGSLFITRHKEILNQTFSITADYMPKEAEGLDINDPFSHSLQWSRRFTGLKLYMSMMIFGWEGYASILRQQVEMGNILRKKLSAAGWKIYNTTELPVVIFGNPRDKSEAFVRRTCNQVLKSGEAWISVYSLAGKPCLRACITNYNTSDENIDKLIEVLIFN